MPQGLGPISVELRIIQIGTCGVKNERMLSVIGNMDTQGLWSVSLAGISSSVLLIAI